MVVGMERFDVTGGTSKANEKCSFAKISENNKDWCNGRGKQGKDALSVCAQSFARMRNQKSTHRPSPYEKRVG